MSTATPKTKNLGDRTIVFLLKNKAILLLVLLSIVSLIVTAGHFMAIGNLMSISRQIAVSTIMCVGFTVILASGQMDLSVGTMLSLVGICYGHFSLAMPFPWPSWRRSRWAPSPAS